MKFGTVVEKRLEFFANNAVISLLILCSVGLFLRLYYFPYGVPLILDALTAHFFYATDVSILGHLPSNYPPTISSGWPVFLAFFFTIFRFDNAVDYMTLQRLISISLSTLTTIPVYFLCRRFFDRPYAIIGAALFALEPHVIQNSLLGLTEPLYIFLVASSLALFFSSNNKMIYGSFSIVGLATIVRAEGLFLFLPLCIMYIIPHKKESKKIAKIIVVISIFLLTLLPMTVFRSQVQTSSSVVDRVLMETDNIMTPGGHGGRAFTFSAVESYIKLTGWALIPIFIFFVPTGIFFIFKKRDSDKTVVIITMISMMIPVFYAFSFAPDPRYIYPLFPLFCILSIFTVKRVAPNLNRNIFLIFIIGGILLSSSVFLDLKKYDYEHQREAYDIARYVTSVAKGVNEYYPEDSYIQPAEIPDKWPALKSSIPSKTLVIGNTKDYDSIERYIEVGKKLGLTYLVLDGNEKRPPYLNEIFLHGKKYPYLVNVYDSQDHGYKYHVKIYKIDYDRFYSTIKGDAK